MKLSTYTTIFFSLFLTACATPYTVPTNAEKAMLRLVSNDTYTRFSHIDVDTCPDPKSTELAKMGTLYPNETSSLKMYGTSKASEARIMERYIEANKPFNMLLHSWMVPVQYVPGYDCKIGIEFTPEPGKQYEANYIYEKNKCNVVLYSLVASGSDSFERIPEPTHKKLHAWMNKDFCRKR